ncbi:ATP phosphoribosyltransferase [Asticcacaulis biprosthecium C19]|uniref:ATP phosphoribosyltransferase n=1 Tax=Asticcacaulis biprosthecium C19 TaxID=715226 RepID=F4QL64_9CAUL|nr:ATP phosphoribosyltransferase [Asticcacaulis biprosthecium]EGF93439.1 ATP phosphoribosyltransferase [Asticcacaulis biprosthecium C19]
MTEPRLRIAVQKSGRLAERSLELITGAGLRAIRGANELLYRIENHPIDLLRVRDDDIPTFVDDNVAELGIVGYNVLKEHFPDKDLEEIIVMRLGFGKCTLKLAVPIGFDYQGPQSVAGKRIATSYPNILKAWLSDNGITADIVEMRGGVEVAPRMHIADAICDLVSTGTTLEVNNLKPVELVLKSEAVLIKAPHAPQPDLAHIYDMVVRRFDGVTKSTGAKYVMMNAPRDHLDEIINLIPGSGSPTIMNLVDPSMVAIHAVCDESVFWETLDRLKAAGASAILVLPIEKMMP